MKPKQILAILFYSMFLLIGCKNSNPPEKKRVEILAPEALSIVDSSAAIEVIAQGFKWAEGPLYISNGDYLLFSDVQANKIYKWKEGEGASVYLNPSGTTDSLTKKKDAGSNGLILDTKGDLVLCQQGDRRMAGMVSPLNNPKSEFATIADNYNGKKLNSPNDAVYAPNGNLYFTDPAYGFEKGLTDPEKQLDFQGVFCLKPDGKLLLLTNELKYPNGLALSPDGKFLYVSNSDADNKLWMKYELNEEGLIKNKQVFYHTDISDKVQAGSPDGMKMNKKGYLFATGPAGVWLFNPEGKLIARIYTGERASNCALSPDEKTLYMTCVSYIMRVKLKG